MKLDNLFFWIGKKVARHPLAVMVISLIATGIILSGLMFLEFEVKLNLIKIYRMIRKNYGWLKILILIMNNPLLARNSVLSLELINLF